MVSQTRDLAPIQRAQLEPVLRPFGASRMLPPEAYVSEEVFCWEQRFFFGANWMCVGRSATVARPGDQRAQSVGRGGVLLIRDKNGSLRSFANACRHRNHELLACGEAVNRPIVLCPYHGWSYRLDGSLRKAPGFGEGGDDLDLSLLGLVELPCAEWHGLIFVDGSGEAAPFDDHVAGLEELSFSQHGVWEVEANWKILSENYQECYHCRVIHPELCTVSHPQSGDDYAYPHAGAWAAGWMEFRDGVETMSLDGKSSASPLPGLEQWRRRIVDYVELFPNVLISLHPDYVMTHVLTPLRADRTHVECTWAFAPEEIERDGFDPSYAVEFWDVTNHEDWRACESVQRGLSSPHAMPGPLNHEEAGVYQFVTMVARGYLGLPLAATTALAGDASNRRFTRAPAPPAWPVGRR